MEKLHKEQRNVQVWLNSLSTESIDAMFLLNSNEFTKKITTNFICKKGIEFQEMFEI